MLGVQGLGASAQAAGPVQPRPPVPKPAVRHTPEQARSQTAPNTKKGAKAVQARKQPRLPQIALEHMTTHAAFRLGPDLPHGGFSAQQMKNLATLLRCHHTGQRHTMSRRLIEILYATGRHYRNAKLLIVAGYRAPRVAREKGNPRSPHKRGVACDFQVSGVSNEKVRDFLRSTFHNIGVGYYPNSGFIHVDVGRKRDAYWIDYSSPGQPARYTAPTSDGETQSD
jgi:uncharacterized protein YcbK (DUF882 family)